MHGVTMKFREAVYYAEIFVMNFTQEKIFAFDRVVEDPLSPAEPL